MMPKITLKAARVNAELTLDEAAERIGKSKQSIEMCGSAIRPSE